MTTIRDIEPTVHEHIVAFLDAAASRGDGRTRQDVLDHLAAVTSAAINDLITHHRITEAADGTIALPTSPLRKIEVEPDPFPERPGGNAIAATNTLRRRMRSADVTTFRAYTACPYCRVTASVLSWGDDGLDDRIRLYCDNAECCVREFDVTILRAAPPDVALGGTPDTPEAA